MSNDTLKKDATTEKDTNAKEALKPYTPPEVKSAKIFERLCLKCLKRVGTCADPNTRS